MSKHRRPARTVGTRPLRVGEELRHALADVLMREALRDPALDGVSVTVTEVAVSPDLRHATAFIAPLGGGHAEEVAAALGRCAAFLRGQVARRVRLRYMPDLAFEVDRSFDQASRIDTVLASLGLEQQEAEETDDERDG